MIQLMSLHENIASQNLTQRYKKRGKQETFSMQINRNYTYFMIPQAKT